MTFATEPFGWVTLQCYPKLEILRDRGSASLPEPRTSRSLLLKKGVSTPCSLRDRGSSLSHRTTSTSIGALLGKKPILFEISRQSDS
jgi:hypothetical protein